MIQKLRHYVMGQLTQVNILNCLRLILDWLILQLGRIFGLLILVVVNIVGFSFYLALDCAVSTVRFLCRHGLLPCKKAQIFAPLVARVTAAAYAAWDLFVYTIRQDLYEDSIKKATLLLFLKSLYKRFFSQSMAKSFANLPAMRKFVTFVTMFSVRHLAARIFNLGGSIQRAYYFKTHFFKKYVYTINHKRIALNYLYFTVFSGLSGALLATYIRLELAYPGSHFFKGDSTRYLQVITSHGLIMVFYVVVPLIFGMFANFLIPYHVGSKDVAFPRLNSIGFWILPAGFILLSKPAFLRRQNYKHWDPYDAYASTNYNIMQQYGNLSTQFTRVASSDVDAMSTNYAGLKYLNVDGYAAGVLKEQFFNWLHRLNTQTSYISEFNKSVTFSTPNCLGATRQGDSMWAKFLKDRYSNHLVALYDFLAQVSTGYIFGFPRRMEPRKSSIAGKLFNLKTKEVGLSNFWGDVLNFSSRKQPVVNTYFMKTKGAVLTSLADNITFDVSKGAESLGRNKNRKGGAFANLKNWTDFVLMWEYNSKWFHNTWSHLRHGAKVKPVSLKIQKCSSANSVMSGWTFTAPFSAHTKFTGLGAQDAAIVSVLLAGLSTTISFTNLLITRRTMGVPGLRNRKNLLPFISISLLLVMRMLALITPVLAAAMLMLLMDRHFNTSFFDYAYGGDVIMFHHLFWFFGHPEVYVVIIPAFGIINSILPVYCFRRIASKNHLVWATYVMAYMGFLVWGHHMYLMGLDHRSRSLYSTITVMISLPAVVKIVNWSLTLLNGTLKIDVIFLFIMAFFSFFLCGGLTGLWLSHVGLNIFVHDTFYVVAHFHFLFSSATFSAIFAAIYYYHNTFFHVKYSKVFSLAQLVFWVAGQWITFIPLFWVGYNGLPRRYHDYPIMYMGWQGLATAGHLLTMLSVFFFFLNFVEAKLDAKQDVTVPDRIPRAFKKITYLRLKNERIHKKASVSNIIQTPFSYIVRN